MESITGYDPYPMLLIILAVTAITVIVIVFDPLYQWDCDEQHDFIDDLCDENNKVNTLGILTLEATSILIVIFLATIIFLARLVS